MGRNQFPSLGIIGCLRQFGGTLQNPQKVAVRLYGCFSWRFPLDCTGQHCSGHRLVYCRTRSFSGPSQRALCCAWRGCWRTPACRLLGSAPNRATVPEDSAAPCPRQSSVQFEISARLLIPTEPPESVFPAPDACQIVLQLSTGESPDPAGTALQNSTGLMPV